MNRPGPALRNMLWYQSIWFLAICLGPAAEIPVFMLLSWHLARADDSTGEFIVVLACGTAGYLADSLLASVGLYHFDDPTGHLPAPLWLLGLWMGFAGSLRHSLAFLVRRPRLLTAAGTVGAPLSYLAAMRLDAVAFPHGAPLTLVVVGVTWAILLPLFCLVCQRCDKLPQTGTGATAYTTERGFPL